MFDLDLYLERIHLAERPAADADGLARLQRAHRLAIPFENLDVRLGRAIKIDSDSVFAKIVTARRGGYCFEQNRLFLDALEALGFTARPILARVWLGVEHPAALLHALSLVTIGGQDWIADAGFGGSYAPPMPLADGEHADAPDGARFRLGRDPVFSWMLEREGPAGSTDGRGDDTGWQRQYSLDGAPVFPADLALSNFWTAHAPESRFHQLVVASLALPNGFATLTDRAYRRHTGKNTSASEITDPRVYRMRLSLMFGIDLTAEEVAGLGLFEAA